MGYPIEDIFPRDFRMIGGHQERRHFLIHLNKPKIRFFNVQCGKNPPPATGARELQSEAQYRAVK
jgi:hypothetical protein